MNKKAVLYLLFLILCNQVQGQTELKLNKTSPFSIGEIVNIDSEILGEKRTINVYLPNNYQVDSLKQYPVIYLLDGSADEDFIHISGLVQFGSFSWINMIPETIVVGIANIDRKHDFSYPTKNERDKKDFPTTGGSADFIDFIEKELQGLVNDRYRTNSIKTIIGQSLGGLLATEILAKQPDLFDNYIIISPSLWWDDESLLKHDFKAYGSTKSIYIGVGKEGEVMERVAKELYQKLESISKENTKLSFGFFEKQIHGDVLHLAAYDSFEKIFRKQDK